MKNMSLLVSTACFLTPFIGADMHYVQDVTPEHIKAPHAYLAAVATGDTAFNAEYIRYALAEAGQRTSKNTLKRIKDLVTEELTTTNKSLTLFTESSKFFHYSRLFQGCTELGIAAAALAILNKLRIYRKPFGEQRDILSSKYYFNSVEAFFAEETCRRLQNKIEWAGLGILSCGTIAAVALPYGMYHIYRSQSTLYIQELKTLSNACSYLIEMIDELIIQA